MQCAGPGCLAETAGRGGVARGHHRNLPPDKGARAAPAEFAVSALRHTSSAQGPAAERLRDRLFLNGVPSPMLQGSLGTASILKRPTPQPAADQIRASLVKQI